MVTIRVDEENIDLTSCPPNKEHMNCYLTGEEVDQRAKCAYCWLHSKLESYHPDSGLASFKLV